MAPRRTTSKAREERHPGRPAVRFHPALQGLHQRGAAAFQEWDHYAFLTPAFTAPSSRHSERESHFNPSWAVEINYYIDLGFLPPGLQYFAVSGRAGFYGPKGTGAAAGVVAPYYETKTEIKTEPVRLTFDAGKAFWGQKYSQLVQLFVAYR